MKKKPLAHPKNVLVVSYDIVWNLPLLWYIKPIQSTYCCNKGKNLLGFSRKLAKPSLSQCFEDKTTFKCDKHNLLLQFFEKNITFQSI